MHLDLDKKPNQPVGFYQLLLACSIVLQSYKKLTFGDSP